MSIRHALTLTRVPRCNRAFAVLLLLSWALLLVLSPASPATAQAPGKPISSPILAQSVFDPAGRAGPIQKKVRLEMEDGSVITGTVIDSSDTTYTIQTTTMGTVTVERSRIIDTEWLEEKQMKAKLRGRPGEDPDYNSLLFMPTPETLPVGDYYYRNFELLFNNFGATIADGISVSAAAAFPVTGDLLLFSFGGKVRILSRDEAGVGLALAGSSFFADNESAQTLTGIVGIGDRRRSLNVAVNYAFASGDNGVFWMVGGDFQVGRGFKLLAEYANSENSLFADDDFNGLINVGFRAFWRRVSFTLTGFRPLEETGGSFIAFPMASFSAHF